MKLNNVNPLKPGPHAADSQVTIVDLWLPHQGVSAECIEKMPSLSTGSPLEVDLTKRLLDWQISDVEARGRQIA